MRAVNGVNIDSANRKAELHGSSPASNSSKVSQLWPQFSVTPISGWYCQMLQITAQVGIEEKGRGGFLGHVPLSIKERDKPHNFIPGATWKVILKPNFLQWKASSLNHASAVERVINIGRIWILLPSCRKRPTHISIKSYCIFRWKSGVLL